MSRNMISANTSVFAILDKCASDQGAPLANAGKPRWVATFPLARKFLKEAICSDSLRLSNSLRIARFDFDGSSYIVTSGMNFSESEFASFEIEIDGGILVAAISEMDIAPKAGSFAIKDIVEAGDRDSGPSYVGHDARDISSLFPTIQCFKVGNIDPSESSGTFFLFCLNDTRARQWMSAELLSTLRIMVELSPVETPYATLCRSIFDHDPASLFLALYRCLEALYAWSLTNDLMRELSLKGHWTELAQTLEASLGWRPREEQSLVGLLALADPRDLREIAQVCGGENDFKDPAATAGKRVYALRNSLVHYRPIHRNQNHESIDWNRLCELMATVAFYVYSKIMSGGSLVADPDPTAAA